MELNFDQKIIELSKILPTPLYAVGGYVRDFLIDGTISDDIDLASPISVDEILPYIEKVGLVIVATYKRTGTVVFKGNGIKYEFTSFRRDVYDNDGTHTPTGTVPTDNILEDAKRRDFKCNAIYYDIKNKTIVDPLNGVDDVKNKVLDTVVAPEKVFCFDGLRLMRLARFSGELGFMPTLEVIERAKENAKNIDDISVERIYDELKRILVSDTKNKFSSKEGHYVGLKILDRIGVLERILPELTLGRGMAQRSDFHKFDVLEHSLRCVLYAKPQIRLAALFHDIAKPFCFIRDGKYYMHAIEGKKMVEDILRRLKADNATIKEIKFLVSEHMFDLDSKTSEDKVRKFIVRNFSMIEKLLMVKQADFRASLEQKSTCPTVTKWRKIIRTLKTDGTPFTLKGLDITADDLINLGVKKDQLSKTLNMLWDKVIVSPTKNKKEILAGIVLNNKK